MNLHELFGRDIKDDELPSFIAKVEEKGNVRLYRLRGPFDETIAAEAQEKVAKLRDAGEKFDHHLLLDFGEVTSVNFSTVAYMVRSVGRRQKTGKRLGYFNVDPALDGAIEIAKLQDMFTRYGSEAEALADLAGS